MNLIELIEEIWDNSNSVEFGGEQNWLENANTFKKDWFTSKDIIYPNAPGLYWFSSNINLKSIERPTNFPLNGCDINLVYANSSRIFHKEILTKKIGSWKVIYNGHESNVANRIRSHFALNNDRTGALGLRHYNQPLKRWKVSYFSTQDVNQINKGYRRIAANLLNSKPGRTALENAWRIKYGWPPLCKE